MSDAAGFLIAALIALWLAPAWVCIPLFALAGLCLVAAMREDD